MKEETFPPWHYFVLSVITKCYSVHSAVRMIDRSSYFIFFSTWSRQLTDDSMLHIYPFILVLLIIENVSCRGNEDYFANKFDEKKNCVKEKLMTRLLKDEDHDRCATRTRGSFNKQWEGCKTDLVSKLAQRCNPRNIEKVTSDTWSTHKSGNTSSRLESSCTARTEEGLPAALLKKSVVPTWQRWLRV